MEEETIEGYYNQQTPIVAIVLGAFLIVISVILLFFRVFLAGIAFLIMGPVMFYYAYLYSIKRKITLDKGSFKYFENSQCIADIPVSDIKEIQKVEYTTKSPGRAPRKRNIYEVQYLQIVRTSGAFKIDAAFYGGYDKNFNNTFNSIKNWAKERRIKFSNIGEPQEQQPTQN